MKNCVSPIRYCSVNCLVVRAEAMCDFNEGMVQKLKENNVLKQEFFYL